MVEFIKKFRIGTLVEALVAIVFGVLLIARPNETGTLIVNVLGIVMIVLGTWDIAAHIYEKKEEVLSAGILKIIIGVFFLTHTARILTFISYVFGLYILIDGVKELEIALRIAGKKAEGWFVYVLLAVLIIACGVVMLFVNPPTTFRTLAIWAGIALIVDGIIGICLVVKWKKVIDKIKIAVTDVVKKAEE